ncbi:hypothetical protein COV17_01665 [Candidatus Woesearchaeota archaeon CG10_big_fil_rev_8_21_14_0_10_36_11]|nr:MAG: hypothetical protein COV17_01665 [Candidatus Woesearchaeota archaeon CG10_big_fil_rev_8_21_14_0_10_36_11]
MSLTHFLKETGIRKTLLEMVPKTVRPIIEEAGYQLTTVMDYGKRDMFTSVAVETTSVCTRRCSYCPVGDDTLRNQRPQQDMGDSVYNPIILDLQNMGYAGTLALQHYGEPLRDKKLVKRVDTARKLLPNAFILIRSNGDLLTPRTLDNLIAAGIDEVFVTTQV